VKRRYEIIQTHAEGYYYQALGNLGYGNPGTAEQFINRALKINPSDIGALRYFKGLK
jgi:hypothetical protein